MLISKHGKITLSEAGAKCDFDIKIICPGDDHRGCGSDRADLRDMRQMFMTMPNNSGGTVSATELSFELTAPTRFNIHIRGEHLPTVQLIDLSGTDPIIETVIPVEMDACKVCRYWAVRNIKGVLVCSKCEEIELIKARPLQLSGHALRIETLASGYRIGHCLCGWVKNNCPDRLEQCFEQHLNHEWVQFMREGQSGEVKVNV